MGELYSTSDHSFFEMLRGGNHDTVAMAIQSWERDSNTSLRDALEGMLK